jgi:pilus assembly protein Flp/PilA
MEHITKFLIAFYVRANEVVTNAKDRGATATEYALLVGLIALAIAAAVFAFGGDLSSFFTSLGGKVNNWVNGTN